MLDIKQNDNVAFFDAITDEQTGPVRTVGQIVPSTKYTLVACVDGTTFYILPTSGALLDNMRYVLRRV